ncbi:MAG: sigma-54-dependent Fis family transcriptional regulator [Sandaracinaceae bacterium]|nr:sigma-54-dependent Fis family transcriptional regulator [Sandaracinaceae bacterium]
METTSESLHASDFESLGRDIMAMACEQTGAHHGAILLWDEAAGGLALDFHVVEDRIVTLPDEVIPLRKAGRVNGVAAHVFESNAPYLANDTSEDPYYGDYFFDVLSIAAAPIRYQGRPIGVLSVSSRRRDRFEPDTLERLGDIATQSALFLRRAQLYRATRTGPRPFLIKGLSPAWLEVERRIERVSGTDAPILVTGESGTGKELVAHAIHFNSRRATAPFVSVNCAAIPDQLLESVLFGHVRGAFTGATADKRGEFQKAHGGTLFLDELGELPMPLQAKVLRAVEDGEVQPLGSNAAPETVDVRLVAATNRDLPAMARAGTFREDLYFRLSVITMELPPLRTYKQDNLHILAAVFLKQACDRHGREVRAVGPDAMAALYAYDFPGNVRELRNAIEHGVIMASGATIQPSDLPKMIVAGAAPPPAPVARPTLAEMRERWLAPLERRWLKDLLDEHDGNVREAARVAGVSAVTFYKLLARRGMGRSRG